MSNPTLVHGKRQSLGKTIWKHRASYLLMAPYFILFFFFTVLPVLMAIGVSFTDWNMLEKPELVGWQNYVKLLLDDEIFIISLKNTLIFAVITGPVSYMLCLLFAWIINEFNRGMRTLLTLIFYAPSICGNAYMVWNLILTGDRYGYLNGILLNLDIINEPILWMKTEQYVMPMLIIVQLWLSLGTGFLSFIAGLQTVDKSMYEAAAIDGIKNRWQELWYVTLPAMKPQLMFGAVMQITQSFAVADISINLAGNALLFTLMFICGVFMALPLVMIINNALKPLDELYQFPPKIFVRNPNLRNFSDLFILMNDSWVPFSRYIMNTIIITVAGMVGHVIVASWAAYPLAKDKFPGKALLFGMVVLSMMFNWTVTQIPQYAIISWLHINNTYLALILPAWSFGMGLYLMKQFMEQLPDSLMESARVQGANEWQIFWKIVMPNVKPAWLTLAIFQFQQMWGNTGSLFLRDEQLKPMQYALQQITAGGVSRAGAAAAVTFIIMAVPVLFFLLCQSSILETMTTSGMKD